ncbi:MAG TPA: response regulator transcription factor [Povalibacter sp.]|uniref:response regulator transcription factor n=1 Tax=Povalibacter sp. TaxID=1962978 RepID=UPI002C1EB2E0|nr:response regulator transcription factor [Povalibacter sp.]HMN46939.1 response regulator transcription factor [Povalibacter sp.]
MFNARENDMPETHRDIQQHIRVLIVDDHAILRAGVREMLADEEDLMVVGEAGSAEEALQLLESGTKVDVVVLDITLPGQSGIELLKQLRDERPELAILVLSMHPERSFAVRLMRAGANGYVPKMIVPEELVKAVRAVGAGRRYITPIVAELLASDCAANEEGPMHNRLSERELQVFTRIARGISPAVMANELGLSVKTVSTYRARILEKMAMRSNAEIAAYAVRNELVD